MVSECSPLLSEKSRQGKFASAKAKTKECIRTNLPICQWLPQYTCNNLVRDIIAGFTVGLMVLPQGLAYATIAGLPLQYGLYSAYMGCFVYCLLGGSKDVTLGPTAIMSLMVNRYTKGNPFYAVALTLFCGIVQLTMGVLRLGFVVRFISIPIISGFVSAAAVTIGFGQVKSLLGLKKIPRDFFEEVYETFKHISETNLWDLLLGSCCIVLLLVLKRMNTIKWPQDTENDVSALQLVCRKLIWVVSTARNALIVLAASLVVVAMEFAGCKTVFSLTGVIEQGIPHIAVSS